MSIAEKFEIIADEVYEAGKKAEYDAFWDSFQNNGNRKNYLFGFAGNGWTDTTFKPKYNIVPTEGAQNIFARCQATDLKALLKVQGVTLDFSQEKGSLQNAFYLTLITKLPIISTVSATTLTNMFTSSSYLQEVEKLILKSDGSQTITGLFDYCIALTSIIVEGVIGMSVNLQWSKRLNKASITSIINALSPKTSGLTVTISKTAKEAAFTAEEWATLIATKPNWTISLV